MFFFTRNIRVQNPGNGVCTEWAQKSRTEKVLKINKIWKWTVVISVNLSDLQPFKTVTITLAFQLKFCFISFFPVIDLIAHTLIKYKLNKSLVVEGNKLILFGPILYIKIFAQG